MSVEQVTQLALASSLSFQPRRSSYFKELNSLPRQMEQGRGEDEWTAKKRSKSFKVCFKTRGGDELCYLYVAMPTAGSRERPQG